MNEMFNAYTSLLPIMAVKEENSLYLNFSLIAFSLIATMNHMFAENFAGVTHIVKLLVSNILFSLLDLNPIIGVSISLLDLLPLITKNKTFTYIGELLIQIPRQIIDFYFIYVLFQEKEYYYRVAFIVIAKAIYFTERRLRIKRKERNNFYFLHCFEHLGLTILLCSLTETNPYDIVKALKLFFSFMLFWTVFIYSYTKYLYHNYESRAPVWLKNNKELVDILKKKLEKNLFKGKIHNYICKPWTYHLKMEIITWNKCEIICKELINKIDSQKIDCVVGISTGGAFVGAYIASLLNKPYYTIHSKLWSGTNFLENSRKAASFFMGKDVNPEIQGLPDVKGKRVLLCDDTTYTGITMNKCKKYCSEVLQASEVETLNLWIHERFIPDYYHSRKRVPIFWEWGAEMD